MFTFKKVVLPVFLAGVWISISEFVRNEFLLKSYWISHYQSMDLVFPSEPINGAVWGIWSMCFAAGIFILLQKFSFWQTVMLSWFFGFVLMWLVVGNMGVLPFSILLYALPLSILECLVAVFIIKQLTHQKDI